MLNTKRGAPGEQESFQAAACSSCQRPVVSSPRRGGGTFEMRPINGVIGLDAREPGGLVSERSQAAMNTSYFFLGIFALVAVFVVLAALGNRSAAKKVGCLR